jgi:hypothetical protein
VLTVIFILCLALLRTSLVDGSLLGCDRHVVVFGLTRPLFVRGTGPPNIRSSTPPIEEIYAPASRQAWRSVTKPWG